eukprot:6285851-Heterocapsa_arctica.AAC.1
MEDSAHRKHWFGKLRPEHSVAAKAAVKTGCNSTVVHKANTELVQADGGIFAGCGFAVHFRTKARLRAIGQRLNDAKEHIFVPFEAVATIFRKIIPDYKGKIGQAVVDIGITHRTQHRASLNKGKRVSDTNRVVKLTKALALAVREQ